MKRVKVHISHEMVIPYLERSSRTVNNLTLQCIMSSRLTSLYLVLQDKSHAK